MRWSNNVWVGRSRIQIIVDEIDSCIKSYQDEALTLRTFHKSWAILNIIQRESSRRYPVWSFGNISDSESWPSPEGNPWQWEKHIEDCSWLWLFFSWAFTRAFKLHTEGHRVRTGNSPVLLFYVQNQSVWPLSSRSGWAWRNKFSESCKDLFRDHSRT